MTYRDSVDETEKGWTEGSQPIAITMGSAVADPSSRSYVDKGVRTILSRASKLVGDEAVQARLADLAANSPEGDGKIHIYFADNQHGHNIFVGIPYTGILSSQIPQDQAYPDPDDPRHEARLTAHELAHAIFGKFNDGFAEPIANLLVVYRSHPQPTKAVATSVVSSELVTLGLLQARQADPKLLPEFSFESMLALQPSGTFVTCEHQAAGNSDTRKFLEWVYKDELRAYYMPILAGEKPVRPGKPPVAAWKQWRAKLRPGVPGGNMSPNKSFGARGLNSRVGNVLMYFLIERAGVPAFLEFYYTPSVSGLQAKFGYDSYAALEDGLRTALETRYRRLFKGTATVPAADIQAKWQLYLAAIGINRCYQQALWHDRKRCGDPDPTFRVLDGVVEFLRCVLEELDGPSTEGPPTLHPVVQAFLDAGTPAPTDITRQLGSNYDFGQYCSASHWSKRLSG